MLERIKAMKSSGNTTREENIAKALKLREQGLIYKVIGKKIGVAESTARKWCNPHLTEHFRAQGLKYREKNKGKRRIKIKEYNQRPEVKERNNRRIKEKKMQKFIDKGYKVHPDGYLLDMKCDGCGELFDTQRRGPMAALRVYKTMFCTKECRIKVQIRKCVAAKRQKQNPNCKGGLRKFNCPHCGDKIETYRAQLKFCDKRECHLIQQRISQAPRRGEWVEVNKECRHCKEPFTVEVRERTPSGHAQDPIKATENTKYCSRQCTISYRSTYLTDSFIKGQIRSDFRRAEGMTISNDQISPQMVEDKRLLLKLNRAWKTRTGKHHPSRYLRR